MTAIPKFKPDPVRDESVETIPHVARALEGQPGEAERERMIAEAAYYRAEKRGFAPGAELDDWLAAEREIEALAREST